MCLSVDCAARSSRTQRHRDSSHRVGRRLQARRTTACGRGQRKAVAVRQPGRSNDRGGALQYGARPFGCCGPPGGRIALPPSESEKRQLTVLCAGLLDLASLAVTFDLEDVGDVIREFQDACTSAIEHMEGSACRWMGGEVLAVFGFPHAHEDDAERAVQAGLDLVAKVGQLRSSSGKPLQAQVGIATGLILIGGERHVVGEAAGVAARLQIVGPQTRSC